MLSRHMLPKHCRSAYAFDSIHLKASDTLTPAADENDPAEQPVHTDELVAPAERHGIPVTDAINSIAVTIQAGQAHGLVNES